MWHPSISSIALIAASLHLALADRIEARDGKLFDKNPFREPLGGKVDTKWPVVMRWDPDTKGTVSLKLLKGKAPEGMQDYETIADHIKNTGIYIWLTGDWLEDSSTMKEGYKYGIKIIDDDTGNYNYSPDFDLIVPHSTFKESKNAGKDAKKGSTKDTTDEEPDFEEPDKIGSGKHAKPKHHTETKGHTHVPDADNEDNQDEDPTVGVGKSHKYHGKPKPHNKGSSRTHDSDPEELDFEEPDSHSTQGHHKPPSTHIKGSHKKPSPNDEPDFEEPEGSVQKGQNHYHQHEKPKSHPESKGSHKKPTADTDDEDFEEPENKQHSQGKSKLPNDNHKKPPPANIAELDYVEPEGSVQKGQDHYHKNSGKPKSSIAYTDTEDEDFIEPDSPITGSKFKPGKPGKPDKSKIKVDNQDTISQEEEEEKSSSSKKGLPKAAVIGIAVGVVVFVVAIALGFVFWKRSKHMKSMAQKKRSRIGYDGVGSFIAEGRRSKPQMTQYNPRHSVESRYDPPTGQGLPVVGSTPRHSVDAKYDPPSTAPSSHH